MIQIPPRRVAVALLAAPVLLGGVAFAAIDAIQTTRAPEGYRISIAPGRQSAAPGQGLRYAVAIRRSGGFSKPVALRLSGLPRGTKARWIQQDGTRAAVLPGGAKGAVLTLRTTRRTPTGTRRITLHASGGGIQRQVRLVARIRRKRFGVWALPARAVVASGDAARFRVKVQRGKHFKGRVRLRVTRLPRGARASLVAQADAAARQDRARQPAAGRARRRPRPEPPPRPPHGDAARDPPPDAVRDRGRPRPRRCTRARASRSTSRWSTRTPSRSG